MTEEILLPALDSEYAVSVKSMEGFQRDGHVLLRGVCSPEEIAAFGPVLVSAATRFQWETRPLEERDTFGKAFLLVGGLWNRDAAVAQFTLARRFARIAAELMSVEATRLYHDVAINKEPGGGPTPWHQDAFYWPMETDHSITMWMPLVDITHTMGGLNFASGSHKAGYLGEGISDSSHAYFDQVIAERGFPVVSPVAEVGVLKAGDATFHAGWTLHSAPGNASPRARQVMTVVYYADGVKTYKEMGNPNRESDFRAYMPGVIPGELAVSPLNPLVYSRTTPSTL